MAVNVQFDVDDPEIREALLDLAAEHAKQHGGRAATSIIAKSLVTKLIKSGKASALLGLDDGDGAADTTTSHRKKADGRRKVA